MRFHIDLGAAFKYGIAEELICTLESGRVVRLYTVAECFRLAGLKDHHTHIN